MSSKSPFMIYQDFLNPKQVDRILKQVSVAQPNFDADGYPTKLERSHEGAQTFIYEKLQELLPEIADHYDLKIAGVEPMVFQHYPENMAGHVAEAPHAENAKYVRKKWVKCKNVDLTAVVWFKSYQNKTPLDKKTEVYGGKLEFPQYNFSLNPEAGTLVVFPAYPHFIKAISKVLVGELYQVKINIAADGVWLYDPTQFSGDWREWFNEYL